MPRGTVSVRFDPDENAEASRGIGILLQQWGAPPEVDAARTVFAIHLDDGSDVVALVSDAFPENDYLIVSAPDGGVLTAGAFSARAETVALDQESGASFPLDWTLDAPGQELHLNIRSAFDGQALEVIGVRYWLARCDVTGTVAGRAVAGPGYVLIRGEAAERP